MRVLSVDWDYFFPNVEWYDWGHAENLFFIEQSWYHRCGCHNLMTGERAVETVNPDKKLLENFWTKRISKIPSALCISESHANLHSWLKHWTIDELVNFDQHHDLGYPTAKGTLECGNWAGKMLNEKRIKRYTLVYPPWRKEKKQKESKIPKRKEVTIHYNAEEVPKQEYDAIFICRSGAWTPSWSDSEFGRFVAFFTGTSVWNEMWFPNYLITNPMKERKPNRTEAIVLANEYERKYADLGLLKMQEKGYLAKQEAEKPKKKTK